MEYSAHTRANSSKDERSSSVPAGSGVALDTLPAPGCMLTQMCARLNSLLRLIEHSNAIGECAQSPLTSSITAELTPTCMHLTPWQAIDLEYMSSEMERLIWAIISRIDSPLDNLAWNGYDEFVSIMVDDQSEENEESYQDIFKEA